ncbi:putative copper resistance protein D [Sanguibacter antarcticus]|uniref:Putative copper resistance protein D n=1 Tax=Sanguibacter antarcticus TaxID=372484 RepID=A0A2A9E8Y0_9MICO|nr:putative copper resistance protein D [Sanguibacter antarcticus]
MASRRPAQAPPDAPRSWVGVPVGVVLLALLAVVVGGAFSDAFTTQLLLDPGAVVRWGLPVATVVSELAVAVTLGGLVLAAFVVPPGVALDRTLSTVALGAGTWTVASLVRMVLAASNAVGVPLDAPTFGEQLGVYLTQISAGRAYLAITVTAAVVCLMAMLTRTATGALWSAALTFLPLVLQSLMGHAAGSTSHEIAVSSLFMHLVGAAVWIGGLLVIAVLRTRRALTDEALAVVVARFSPVAAWCFVVVALSGVVNALVRLGGVAGLSTDYGVLILAKAGLFVVLGGFGWAHRSWVVGRLGASAARGSTALFWRLAGAELLVMGAVSGVAVALGGSPPPDDNAPPPDPTPAFIITGRALPPELTFSRWFTEWNWDVLLGFACVAALVVYLRWVRRLHRRGDAWSPVRTVSWVTGTVIMFWVTNGGPAVYGSVLFSAHMLQHMVLAMVIPIFLVSGAPITLALRGLTIRKDGTRGPREWLLVIVHSHLGRFFAHPIVAAINFAGSLIVFYYTPAFEYALSTHTGHILMTVHFTLAGYFFANALIGIDPGPSRPPYAQRLLLLLATMAFHAFFGVTLMSGEILLVPEWFGLMGREWGLSALADQQEGGGIAWGVGELPTISLAVIVAVSWSRADERLAKRRDRKVDRDGDVEMDDYNDMLQKLSDADDRAL